LTRVTKGKVGWLVSGHGCGKEKGTTQKTLKAGSFRLKPAAGFGIQVLTLAAFLAMLRSEL
jgi:hypothetical protein